MAPVERTGEFAHYIRRRSGTGDGPTSAGDILPPQADVMALLKQLGNLRNAGVLTEDEFNTKKRELLARI